MTVFESTGCPLPVRIESRAAVDPPPACDAIVVGGGIIGLLIAIGLRERGRSVMVLEACNVGSAQSGRNMGFVREQGRDAVEAEAMRYSASRWRALAERFGARFGWTGGGHLSIARDEQSLAQVESWGGIAAGVGTRFEVVTGRAARDRWPWLAKDVAGVGYTPDDGHVDPASAMRAIAGLAQDLGVKIVEGAVVEDIERAAGRVEGVVLADGRSVHAPLVVVAAGAWSGRLLSRVGVRLPLHMGRGTLTATKPFRRITESSGWDVTGVGFRQASDGRVIFGMGAFVDVDVRWEDVRSSVALLPTLWQNRRTMRVRPGAQLVRDLGGLVTGRGLSPLDRTEPRANMRASDEGLRRLRELVPAFAELEAESVWAGVIDSTPDFLPIAGGTGIDGLLVVAGTSGHGLGIAPALADGVVAIAEGRDEADLIDALSRQRFPS